MFYGVRFNEEPLSVSSRQGKHLGADAPQAFSLSPTRRQGGTSRMNQSGEAALLNGKTRWLTGAMALTVLCAMAAPPAWGQCESAKLIPVPDDRGENDEFVASVGISGDTLIIGSPGPDLAFGAAHVFRRSDTEWQQEAKLGAAAGAHADDDFGRSVSLSGDVAVIGAPLFDRTLPASIDHGAAFVFRRTGTTWMQEQVLAPMPSSQVGDKFGTSVAVDGDRIIVGAPQTDDVLGPANAGNSGSAYVFHYNGTMWVQEGKLVAADADSPDMFGTTVAIDGEWAFVAAVDDKIPFKAGSVYVFRRMGTNWQQVQRLNASDAADNRRFGGAISLDGTVAAIGDRANAAQRVYVFRYNGANWVEEAKLAASDRADNDFFGTTVAIRADVLLVGAPLNDDNGISSGSAYVFQRAAGVWTEVKKLITSDAAASDRFGDSIAFGEAYAAVGARTDDLNKGSVYVFNFTAEPDCDRNGMADDCEIYAGLHTMPTPIILDANMNGTLDECECMNNSECNDSLACTVDSCDTVTGKCRFDVTSGFCLIQSQCLASGTSNPTNVCQACDPSLNSTGWSPTAEGMACLTDLKECTADKCSAGACAHTNMPAGTSCGSANNSDCDNPDTCNNQGECLPNHKADGSGCEFDALFCTADRCAGGVCQVGPNPCVSPTPACDETNRQCVTCRQNDDCNDGNACTTDVCNQGTCVYTNRPAGTPCGTEPDTVCDHPDRCNANGQCADDNLAPVGTVCPDDGDFCNGVERCDSAGMCVGSGNPCAAPLVCNAAAGRCACTNNSDCSDGLFCNGVETCAAGLCTPAASPCAAGVQCDEQNNRCLACLTATQCNDNDPCTVDTCGNGQCLHTRSPHCDDTDGDGVLNSVDACANTPRGVVVDARGCAEFERDTDGDGVTDERDRCAQTPASEDADDFGCAESQRDDDGDLVTNGMDECPDTTFGAIVDVTGCAASQRDDDRDGVPNGLDRCASTPAGSLPDAEGCAASQRDADRDGVVDSDDQCPGTLPGTNVDLNGCPEAAPNNNGNDNEPPPGEPTPGDGQTGTGRGLCGIIGMINWVFLSLGLAGLCGRRGRSPFGLRRLGRRGRR